MAGSSRIDELRKKFDENPRRYFAPLANEYRKLGDYEQAIFICQEFLPQQPGHMSGHIVYGQALFEASRHDEARTVFETALSLDPENLIALRHLGDIARAHGDTETARGWYRRVLDSDPRNEEIAGILQALDSDPTGAVLSAPTAPGAQVPPAQSPAAITTQAETGGGSGIPAAEAQADIAAALSRLSAAAAPTSEPAARTPSPAEAPSFSPLAGLSEAAAPALEAGGLEQEADLDSLFPTAAGAGAGGNYYQDAPPLEPPPEAELIEESLIAPATTPGAPAFVTETMAELYLQQGHREEAVAVYRQLVELHPSDENLRVRLQALLVDEVATMPQAEAPPAEEGPTIRDFLAALAQCRPRVQARAVAPPDLERSPTVSREFGAEPGSSPVRHPTPPSTRPTDTVGGSLDALFTGAERGHRETARSPLEAAFSSEPADRPERRDAESAAPLRGRPATPAATELSLDHVFRHATPSGSTRAQGEGAFSFDQFFSQQAQGDTANPAPEQPRENERSENDDIQQFNAWLEGLKKT